MTEVKIMARTRCLKCGAVIEVVKQYDTGKEYQYKKFSLENRYIDKWGYGRNFCKKCMRSWNVSSIDPPSKSDYICPECEAKEKERKIVA